MSTSACQRTSPCPLIFGAARFVSEEEALSAQRKLPIQNDAIMYSIQLLDGHARYVCVIVCSCTTADNLRRLARVLNRGSVLEDSSTDLWKSLSLQTYQTFAKRLGFEVEFAPLKVH